MTHGLACPTTTSRRLHHLPQIRQHRRRPPRRQTLGGSPPPLSPSPIAWRRLRSLPTAVMLGRHSRRSRCRGNPVRIGSATTRCVDTYSGRLGRSGRCPWERTADGRKPPGRPERSSPPRAQPSHRPPALRLIVPEPSAPNIRHSQPPATATGLTPPTNGTKTKSGGAKASGADVTDPQVLTITRAEASHPRNGHTGPASERLTSPLTVSWDLHKRHSAQR